MDLPFIYKYQPLYLQDFEMDDKLLELIRILIKMDNKYIICWRFWFWKIIVNISGLERIL